MPFFPPRGAFFTKNPEIPETYMDVPKHFERAQHRYERAIIRVQTTWRGRATRKRQAPRLWQLKRSRAATKIQSVLRGFLVRQNTKQIKRRMHNRQAINHFRRQRPFDSEDADRIVEEAPDTEMLAAEQAEQLWAKVRQLLTDAQYDALWFFYGEDRNLEQTARVMDRSPGSVKVLLHRARRKLADELTKETQD